MITAEKSSGTRTALIDLKRDGDGWDYAHDTAVQADCLAGWIVENWDRIAKNLRLGNAAGYQLRSARIAIKSPARWIEADPYTGGPTNTVRIGGDQPRNAFAIEGELIIESADALLAGDMPGRFYLQNDEGEAVPWPSTGEAYEATNEEIAAETSQIAAGKPSRITSVRVLLPLESANMQPIEIPIRGVRR